MNKSQIAILNNAIQTYGIDAQLDMCVEEMSELTKEICKKKRGKNNRNQIAEEIADVEIMLEQLKIMCNISDKEVNNVVFMKICRLEERLKKTI